MLTVAITPGSAPSRPLFLVSLPLGPPPAIHLVLRRCLHRCCRWLLLLLLLLLLLPALQINADLYVVGVGKLQQQQNGCQQDV